ncbi:MAG TPA: branched-chain amino acid ABC transporter permease [Gemmatimonadaceae bacterium]|nr:branched-chain amino acid ABC transporter permease [Gemmatimonadaceae bacterium]
MLQALINALALGSAYALLALGFVLIVNATRAVNFAQGDMVMAGGYVAVALAAVLPVPGVALLPGVIVLMIVLGLVFSLFAYFPLKSRPPVSVFISTIALGIIFQNTANVVFGGAPRGAPPLFSGGLLTVGGVSLSEQSAAVIVVAALLIAGQWWLFARTALGRQLRATAQDRQMAEAIGVRVNGMIAFTFGLAAALAGAAGLLLANTFFVSPTDGTNYIIKAYIAVTIGGWGSLPGAVAGALLIALFEVLYPLLPTLLPLLDRWIPATDTLFSQTMATILLYIAVLLILFFRPQGLFGEVVQRRA